MGSDEGKFTVDHINPNLCTHYLYSFALLNETTFDLIVQDTPENINSFVDLKSKNANLKTLIAIGGYSDSNDGTGKYSNMVSSSDNINTFIGHVIAFVEKYGFDGVDLDWEYPSSPEDKAGFSNLLTTMRSIFDTKGYLLTAAVPAGPYFTEPGTYQQCDLYTFLLLL
jgi:chitinase